MAEYNNALDYRLPIGRPSPVLDVRRNAMTTVLKIRQLKKNNDI
jgi:hypothetical protein